MQAGSVIAYFSMEIVLEEGMPTYSGGLGALAGDRIRSAADLKVPMVGVSLLHRKDYFYQRLDASGWQREAPVKWPVNDFVVEMPARLSRIDRDHARSAVAALTQVLANLSRV